MKTVTNIMTVHQITYTIYIQSAFIFRKKKLIIFDDINVSVLVETNNNGQKVTVLTGAEKSKD